MSVDHLRRMIDRVKAGRMSRRAFIGRLAYVGDCANGDATAGACRCCDCPASNYKATKAGGGGTLKLLWWQGPTLLNRHFD